MTIASNSGYAQHVTLGLVQMTCGGQPEQNLEKAVMRIDEAARRGAQIICLQELFRGRYPCQTEDTAQFGLAEPVPGPTTERLCALAAERQVVLIAPVFEQRAPGLYHNAAVVIDADGRLVGHYRKMHIPDDPLYYEKFYFTPGDLGFRTFSTRYAKIGVLICWDQWFPEGARLTALSGAQILFYPTAIGWQAGDSPRARQSQVNAWQIVQRSHAITNGVFVAAVNRIGQEDALDFWGASFVSDPFGRILAEAPTDAEDTLVVPCKLDKIGALRQVWPFLRDRRIDAYADLTKRFLD